MAKEVKTEIVDLAKKLEDTIKIDSKKGNTEVTGDPFKENLPDGLSMDTVAAVKDYNTTFVAASSMAFGNLAIEAMTKNKSLEQANVSFGMGGRDSVEHTFIRQKDVRNVKTGETMQKFGSMTTTMEIHAGNQKAGQLGAVRAQLSELATERFKK
jgi:UPF0288 family protein (methanogenesis marker protein 3)